MQSLSTLRPVAPLRPPAEEPFLASGHFVIGANYWASHAGTAMWQYWDEDVVREDFRRLAEGGLQVLRVFPLWSDFQPIQCLRRENGTPVEFRHGDAPLAQGPIGQSGVSPLMLKRFERLCHLAEASGLRLVVGLITGWMSGRLFVPPALEGLNHLTDPSSLVWQIRLVGTLVRQSRHHSAICAWDLGNECNCLDRATKDEAWLWTAAIANAIRAGDATRPVISGMHSLPADSLQAWAIRDQGELTDILTTHPYPLFTPHCNREPMNTLRPLLHGTAETCLYADLSGKPAFVEETGNFGPAFCDEETAADIARVQAYSLWAHDCRGLLWWCAHEQSTLAHPPYDWISMERELGLLRTDGSAKPVFNALARASATIDHLPIDRLPPRRIDATCILTEGQEQWAAAYSTFLLAKQAGFDVGFCYGDRPFPDSSFYLLPSICNLRALSRRREFELRERVEAGATLYVSADDGFLGEIMKMTGLHVRGRHGRLGRCDFSLAGHTFSIPAATQYLLGAGSATILAEADGVPIFSVAECGKGKVYFLAAPLETSIASANGAFLAEAPPYWKVYTRLWQDHPSDRHIRKTHPALGITEHAGPDGSLLAVLINHQPERLETPLRFSAQFRFGRALVGPAPDRNGTVTLLPNAVAVWEFPAA